jgi:hypothetical protein
MHPIPMRLKTGTSNKETFRHVRKLSGNLFCIAQHLFEEFVAEVGSSLANDKEDITLQEAIRKASNTGFLGANQIMS